VYEGEQTGLYGLVVTVTPDVISVKAEGAGASVLPAEHLDVLSDFETLPDAFCGDFHRLPVDLSSLCFQRVTW
jgi:hypothetical protein